MAAFRSPDQVLFAHVVDRDDGEIDLATASLLLGEFEYPELDVARYLSVLEEFAAAARSEAARESGAHGGLRALNRTLFEKLGFRGNSDDYYDARNSFLNEVIDRRLGIPITLSVLYLEVGRRLGLALEGLSFPGHFLVRYTEDDQVFVIDPYHLGLTLPPSELRARLEQVLGDRAELAPEYLAPASKRQILSRMLANLAAIYRRSGDTYRNIAVVERMLILEPNDERLARELQNLRRRAEQLN